MKNLFLLLALLYLTTCSTVKLCTDEDEDNSNPSKSDCLKRDLTEAQKSANATCCYVKAKVSYEGKSETGSQCMPLIPAEQNKSKVEQALKDMMAIFGIDAKIEIKELSCFGSYLKLGFLLLSVLLL